MRVPESTSSRQGCHHLPEYNTSSLKINCLIKAVMTSAYQLSSSVLSSGAIGLVSSTQDMVGEAV